MQVKLADAPHGLKYLCKTSALLIPPPLWLLIREVTMITNWRLYTATATAVAEEVTKDAPYLNVWRRGDSAVAVDVAVDVAVLDTA